ncbi:ATP-dependent DNA ligase [Roseivirga sp. BDSF3-8]|uniref:ATP-dependent DNA ligase n=1 Tax=Roseivirga sp. BDSF3-8 TaxID=3241598 RepID=UPI00353258F3
MKQFAQLFTELDQTNKTNEKVAALKRYFSLAPDQDKLWALALFTHKRPKRQVNSPLLRQWAREQAGIPEWLFDESYHVVGDLAETMSLLLPFPSQENDEGLTYWMEYILAMAGMEEEEKKYHILQAWDRMTKYERFVFTKLMTGGFRLGVSQALVVRAIAEVNDIDKAIIAHRIMGNWTPQSETFESLVLEESQGDDLSRPYPFYLAYPLESAPEELGSPYQWQAEWKWDGIRSQFIFRGGNVYIWSRGEELITDKFPELHALQDYLPDDVVIDAEIMPYKDGTPLPFASLQTRIGRKNVTKNILKKAPAVLFAYDLLELHGEDLRKEPMSKRRSLLEEIADEAAKSGVLLLSPTVNFASWSDLAHLREKSREYYAEGFMLKHVDSPYQVGRKRGDWWKWKVEPLSIDGVLLYAQKGHGRRADLYSDYTFAVWDVDTLVPFAKAYSGLTDTEMKKVDNFVKRNTKERFGPVRTVKPELVFEIGFEGIQSSSRHKSGVAVRFPRMLRWRLDKKPEEANTLEELQSLLEVYGPDSPKISETNN